MLSGECVGFRGAICDCGRPLALDVQRSAAGFYLGYVCPECGPYSRETYYYEDEDSARVDWLRFRVIGSVPGSVRVPWCEALVASLRGGD